MPCRDDYPYDINVNNTYQEKIDKLARMLCSTLTKIEQLPAIMDHRHCLITIPIEDVTTKETRKWWNEHKEKDRIRKDKEYDEKRKKELKNKLLKSLSPEELDALGVIR